ncbi:MAG: hypothetical protein FWG47_07055, partial [Propionibacteriaceae bacterium]|nr:hypothetical protein [Propionibacteriaceae bacterium]
MPNRPRRAEPSFAVFLNSTLGKIAVGGFALTILGAGASLVFLVPTQSSAADVVEPQAPTSSIASIVKDRETSLSLDGKAIAQSNTENVLANRQNQLAFENQAIL